MTTSLLPSPQERFDARNKTYTTSAGLVVKLRPIGPGAIDHKREQFSKMKKKPQAPVLEVSHGKGRTSEVPNIKDELYLALLAEHDSDVGRMMVEWIFATGIDVTVPDNPEPGSVFAGILEGEESSLPTITRRYLYINSAIDANDYAFLLEAIVGQQGVTQMGLSQAAKDFQDNG